MGLDIRAYRRLSPAPDAARNKHGYVEDCDRFVQLHPNQAFPGRADDIIAGVPHSFAETMGFRAGSYSGYGDWRRALARLVGRSAEDIWDNPTPGPFVELINFSDCEGVIGAAVSAKLAKDFADHQDEAGSAGWFAGLYTLWRKAFEMAADGGAVDFR